MGKHTGGQRIYAPEHRKPFGPLAVAGKEVFGFLRTFLPGGGVSLNGQSCTYDLSPDGDFIIDTLPENDNELVISGLSGHDFKFISILGEIAAGLRWRPRQRFRFNAVFPAPLFRRLLASHRAQTRRYSYAESSPVNVSCRRSRDLLKIFILFSRMARRERCSDSGSETALPDRSRFRNPHSVRQKRGIE